MYMGERYLLLSVHTPVGSTAILHLHMRDPARGNSLLNKR